MVCEGVMMSGKLKGRIVDDFNVLVLRMIGQRRTCGVEVKV